MEKNSVLRKVSPGGRQPACRDPGGQEKIKTLSFRAIATLSLDRNPTGRGTPKLPAKCHSSVHGGTVVALICLGKVVLLLSWGRRRVKKGGGDRRSPAHVFHMVILIFQRDLCSPPSFPLCPVGRSTAAKKKKKCSLCSVASCWWCFCSF